MKQQITVDFDKLFRNRGGYFSEGMLELYRSIVTDCTNTKMIEVGCCGGESTVIAAMFFGKVYAIDIWDSSYFGTAKDEWNPEMQFDLLSRWYNNIEKLKGSSHSFVDKFEDQSIDVVYLDSDKTEHGMDEEFRDYFPKIKMGGYLCGHDYRTPYSGNEFVKATIEKYFGKPDATFRDFSWMVKKTREQL